MNKKSTRFIVRTTDGRTIEVDADKIDSTTDALAIVTDGRVVGIIKNWESWAEYAVFPKTKP